ncbi:MAG: SurA N-terminal domain-containing protein [Thermodesulfobacteriota bacterium]|nr:SurA N-terminal domain-containing protein [Thermodesulfobacteriota bacterium]
MLYKRWMGSLSMLVLILWVMAILPAMAANNEVNHSEDNPDAEMVDRIVAVVNDEIILLSELEKTLTPYREAIAERDLPPETEKKLLYKTREDILKQLIDRELTRQQAEKLGITVDKAQVDSTLEKMKQSMQTTEEQLREMLAREGYTLAEYRQHIRDQLLRDRLVMREIKAKTIVTKEDIQAYYKDNYEKYGGTTKYHLRNIIMQHPSEAPAMEALETVEAQMAAIHKKLENGGDFAALAKQYSQSSFAEEGGDLGLFAIDDLAPGIKEAVKDKSPGTFTDVLKTGQGYQIFYVEDVVEAGAEPLEAVEKEIRDKLYKEKLDKRFDEWVEALREKSHIQIIR